MTYYIGPFLLLLVILVVVHELGHFAVAKWFKVKVERFSVGFGPSLLRKKFGETEYVLAWLPLGGYVKMVGESPDEELAPEDVARSFNGQSPMRRIWIALAGPGMNVILSIVVIASLYMSGWPTVTSRIGSVLPDSPAAAAGLRADDRIVAIDGSEVWRWQDLTEAVRASRGAALALTVEREGETVSLPVTPAEMPSGSGLWIGVTPSVAAPVIGVADSTSPAGRAGLATGDSVRELNGQPVGDWYSLVRMLEASSGPLEFEVTRKLDDNEEIVRLQVPGAGADPWSLERLGAAQVDYAVIALVPGKPAKRAGFERGDILLSANGQPLKSFESFAGNVRNGGGAPLSMVVLRNGREVKIEVTPTPETDRVDGELVSIHRIGLSGGPPSAPPEMVADVVANPLRALWLGTERTFAIAGQIVEGVRMLVAREVSVDNLAGPIGIGELAGDSFAEEGWFPFLWMMCWISVNLAILNLLPIPILDGGHIVFALAEAVRGKAVSLRAREIAQTVGISMVLFLIGFAFWNDISRNWAGIIGFFKGLI